MNRKTVLNYVKLGAALGVLGLCLSCDHGLMDVPAKGPKTIDYQGAVDGKTSSEDAQGQPSASADGAQISGQVSLSPDLANQKPGDGTLFIIARKPGAKGGPPLAVLRLAAEGFPMAFKISQENVMMTGTPFEGKLELTVRFDTDGNAMTKGAGDLQGKSAAPIAVGQGGVDLVLDTSL